MQQYQRWDDWISFLWVGQSWLGMCKRTPARHRMDLKSIRSKSMGVTPCGKLWLKVSSLSQQLLQAFFHFTGLRHYYYLTKSTENNCRGQSVFCHLFVLCVPGRRGGGSFSTVCWWPAASYQSTLFKSRLLLSTRVWSFSLLCVKRRSMGTSRVWYLWVNFLRFLTSVLGSTRLLQSEEHAALHTPHFSPCCVQLSEFIKILFEHRKLLFAYGSSLNYIAST